VGEERQVETEYGLVAFADVSDCLLRMSPDGAVCGVADDPLQSCDIRRAPLLTTAARSTLQAWTVFIAVNAGEGAAVADGEATGDELPQALAPAIKRGSRH